MECHSWITVGVHKRWKIDKIKFNSQTIGIIANFQRESNTTLTTVKPIMENVSGQRQDTADNMGAEERQDMADIMGAEDMGAEEGQDRATNMGAEDMGAEEGQDRADNTGAEERQDRADNMGAEDMGAEERQDNADMGSKDIPTWVRSINPCYVDNLCHSHRLGSLGLSSYFVSAIIIVLLAVIMRKIFKPTIPRNSKPIEMF